MTAAPAGVGRRTLHTARSVAWLTGGEIAGKAATLVLVLATARLLGARGFGAFSFALSLGLVLAVIPSWGFDPVVVGRGSRDRAVLSRLLAEVLAVRAALGLSLWAVVTAGCALGGVHSTPAISVIVASCLADTLTDAFRGVAAVLGVQHWASLALIVQRFAALFAGLGLLLAGAGVAGVGAAMLAGSLLALALLARAMRRLGVAARFSAVRPRGLRELHGASWGVGVHTAVSMALFRLDQVILGVLAGPAAVGRYAAAYRLLETVLFVTWTTAQAVFPLMASAARLRRAFGRSLAVLGALFLPYAAVLLLRGPDLLGLLYGPSYAPAGGVVRWLAPAPLLFAAAYLLAYVFLAAGPAPRLVVASAAALIVNVANLVLIPRFAENGAAFATTLSYLVETIVLVLLVRSRVRLRGWARARAGALPRGIGGAGVRARGGELARRGIGRRGRRVRPRLVRHRAARRPRTDPRPDRHTTQGGNPMRSPAGLRKMFAPIATNIFRDHGERRDRLRVTIVAPYGIVGGAELWLLGLLGATGRLDADAIVLDDGPLPAALRARGVPVSVWPVGRRPAGLVKPALRSWRLRLHRGRAAVAPLLRTRRPRP